MASLNSHADYFLKMEFPTAVRAGASGDIISVSAELTEGIDSLISSLNRILSYSGFPWEEAVNLTDAELLEKLFSCVNYFFNFSSKSQSSVAEVWHYLLKVSTLVLPSWHSGICKPTEKTPSLRSMSS